MHWLTIPHTFSLMETLYFLMIRKASNIYVITFWHLHRARCSCFDSRHLSNQYQSSKSFLIYVHIILCVLNYFSCFLTMHIPNWSFLVLLKTETWFLCLEYQYYDNVDFWPPRQFKTMFLGLMNGDQLCWQTLFFPRCDVSANDEFDTLPSIF